MGSLKFGRGGILSLGEDRDTRRECRPPWMPQSKEAPEALTRSLTFVAAMGGLGDDPPVVENPCVVSSRFAQVL